MIEVWTDGHRSDLSIWLQQYQADILEREYADMPKQLQRSVKSIAGFLDFVALKLTLETPDALPASHADSAV